MLKRIFSGFLQNYRKFLPMLLLLALAFVALGTDTFSLGVQENLRQAVSDWAQKLMPFAINLVVAGILANIAWLFYKPVCSIFEKVLEKSGASERGKDLSGKLLKFFYWALVVFVLLTITAAEILSRFVIGFGVFGAALTLSMQGAANDFICGLLIQICQKVGVNEMVRIDGPGMDVRGKVTDVGYLSTTVESDGEIIRVPNREVWGRPVKVAKPAKSPILLPSEFKTPESTSKSGEKK